MYAMTKATQFSFGSSASKLVLALTLYDDAVLAGKWLEGAAIRTVAQSIASYLALVILNSEFERLRPRMKKINKSSTSLMSFQSFCFVLRLSFLVTSLKS